MHFTIFIKSTIFFRQWQLQFTLSSSLKPLKLTFPPQNPAKSFLFVPNNVLILFYNFIFQSSHPLSAFYMNSLSFSLLSCTHYPVTSCIILPRRQTLHPVLFSSLPTNFNVFIFIFIPHSVPFSSLMDSKFPVPNTLANM